MTDPIVQSRELTKVYRIGGHVIQVLDKVNLSISKGEVVALTGTSGSGKTTLLSILSGLDRPSSGSVCLAGRDITPLSEDELAPVRNLMIGFVFQSFHLIPSLNAMENVMFPAELRKDRHAKEKALQLLERVGMSARRNHQVAELSGGEQQRVAICRALINDPPLIFADEPTGNLDSANSAEILNLLFGLQRERDATLVIATHSREIARRADREMHINDGRITDQGGS